MKNYKLYKLTDYDCIALLLNQGISELQNVQRQLIEDGYIITAVNGIYIHCMKVSEQNEGTM